MKFGVTMDRDEYGIGAVEYPATLVSGSHGGDERRALKNIEEAFTLCLMVGAERVLPLPIETGRCKLWRGISMLERDHDDD